MKDIWFLFHNKDVLVSVRLFHMQLDEYDMSLSYKSTLFKIGDLRNVFNVCKTLRKSPIGRYAYHTKKLEIQLQQPIKNMLLSYLGLKIICTHKQRHFLDMFRKFSFG